MTEPTFSTGFTIHAVRADSDVVVVELAGELDIQTVPQAEAFLIDATAGTPRHLILDLGRVSFMSSSGIGLLLAVNDGAPDIHGSLHLLGVTGNNVVERPLALVGVLDRFDMAANLDTLLSRLSPTKPPID